MSTKEKKTEKKSKVKAVLEDLKAPGLIILGVIGGKVVGGIIDKILPVEESTDGKFNIRALAKPVVQIGTGVAGAILLKNKNLKLIASGVAVSGVATSVKVFLKKDILSGLAGFTNSESVKRVFRDPINLSIEPYNPNLPVLSEHEDKVVTIPVEEYPADNGELADYEEIREVQIL